MGGMNRGIVIGRGNRFTGFQVPDDVIKELGIVLSIKYFQRLLSNIPDVTLLNQPSTTIVSKVFALHHSDNGSPKRHRRYHVYSYRGISKSAAAT